MEREKKDLSFILILLSTLIGTAVLFQWGDLFAEGEHPGHRPSRGAAQRTGQQGFSKTAGTAQEFGNTNRLYHADNRLNPITSMDAETNVILV